MIEGQVYILTNPCLEGWVKIGRTNSGDIDNLLKELNSLPNIPLSFRCYAVYETNKPELVEENIYNLIDLIDDSLHAGEILASSKARERGFFKIYPEKAYSIFMSVATLRGDLDRLKLHDPTNGKYLKQVTVERRSKRSNNSFALLGLKKGDEIVFVNDKSIIARVSDEKNQVEFQGKQYSVTGLARKLLVDKCGWKPDCHVNGWSYFKKGRIILSDMRDRIDSTNSEDK